MNKIYTSIEQSKKLAEILPLESADMEYMFLKKDGSKVSNVPFVKDGFEEPECCYIFIPCWSLAALLEKIPNTIVNDAGEDLKLHIDKYTLHYSLSYENTYTGHKFEIETDMYENLVDACVEMIEKLKERNLL